MIHDDSVVLARMKEVALKNRIEMSSNPDFTVKELIENIRDELNTVAFSNAEKHMLPNWAIQKIWQQGRKKEIPKPFSNDTHRNWTLIGSPGAQNFAISDGHGLTTALEECGSIEFWPKNDEIVFPALLPKHESPFKLVSIEDQIYEWSSSYGPINFQRLVYHVHKGDTEFIVNEINLQNLSLESKNFTFFVAIRPICATGVLPLTKLSYDSTSNCIYSNDLLALKLDRPPASLVMGNFDDPSLISKVDQGNRIDSDYNSVRGIGSAVARFDITLGPAGRESLVFVSPLLHTPSSETIAEPTASYALRDQTIARWFEFNDDLPAGEYPDVDLGKAAAQANVSMMVQLRRLISSQASDDLVLQVGEISRVMLAVAECGYHSITTIALSEFISRFEDHDEIKMNALLLAPLLWVLKELSVLFPDIKLSDDIIHVRTMLETATKENVLQCVETELNASSIDITVDDDDDIPSIESIERRASMRAIPQEKKRVITLAEFLNKYWIYLNASRLEGKDGEFEIAFDCFRDSLSKVETILSKNKTWDFESIDDVKTILGVISAFTLSKNFDIGKDLFGVLVSGMREKRFYRGLVRFPGDDSRISSHYALRIAHAFALLGTRHESELILGKISDYFSDFYYLPAWIDPKTKGGKYGNGCSLTAAADLKLLLRDMLAYEVKDVLYVFPGIPEQWFTSENSLTIRNMPSSKGKISLSTGVSANQHQIEVRLERLPEEIEVFLPEHIPLHMVKVFGGTVIDRLEIPNNRIRLIPLSDQIAITFHRQ